jgi:hypothetical protein
MPEMMTHRIRLLLLTFCMAMLAMLTAACGQLDLTVGPTLHGVAFSPETITPNADGDSDATEIRYSLRRPADISIFFDDVEGTRHYFRDDRRRAPGDYDVLWGGVIDSPYEVDTGAGAQTVLSQVLPDGIYTWTVQAVSNDGAIDSATGTITLHDGDSEPPHLDNFAVVPETFRPNQDGLRDDWVSVSYYLTKDVDSISLYLEDPNDPNFKYFIEETPGVVKPTERGYHDYRYEGGLDMNAEPPPDGDYTITAVARDLAGNSVQVERALTIAEGGKPRADIAGGEIDWQGEVNRVVLVPVGDKLCFETVVVNESQVPIRTSGPWPGAEYHFAENSNTLAAREDESWFQQSGVWRFGINFDTTGVDFPYRWAVGRKEDLELRVIDGVEQYYLMPGKRGLVNGCIIIDEKPPVGTTVWWGGLIHQAVEVANNNVDRITVEVGAP